MVQSAPDIKYFEDFFFDNVVLMAPSIKDMRSPISQSDLIQYLEANHNIMVVADEDTKMPLRSFVNNFGVDF